MKRREPALPVAAWIAAALFLSIVTISGCAPAGAPDASTDGSADPPAAAKKSSAPAQPAVTSVTVPAGTPLVIEVKDPLSSETSRAGDRFTARVVEPVSIGGKVAIPGGATVSGSVVAAVPAKKIGGAAQLSLALDSLTLPSGGEVPIAATFVAQGKKQTKKDAATIGGAAAGGAILGNVVGEKQGKEADGTKIGAAVGAAVGTAIAATNKTDPVTIAPGTVVDVVLDAPVTVKVRA